MKDPYCVVEVGVHSPPYWKDKARPEGFVVCNIHKEQYETAYDGYGPFNWMKIEPNRDK